MVPKGGDKVESMLKLTCEKEKNNFEKRNISKKFRKNCGRSGCNPQQN